MKGTITGTFCLMLASMIFLGTGCGGGPKLSRVEGTVTMDGRSKTSPYIILGEVDTLERTITISLRLVEKQTGKIAAYGRKNVASEKDIPEACRHLSRTIFEGLKKIREKKQ